MRKKLIFAMMIIGTMISCSKDSYVDAPPEESGGEDIPICISAGTTAIGVVTRGTGVVGGTTDATNKWNKQQLFITAFPKNVSTGITTKMELKSNAIMFNKGAFAPGAAEATAGGIITWENPAEVVYFPRNGAYDFFGYHVDDANIGTVAPVMESVINGVQAGMNDTIWSVPVTIDGSQDLMIAKAALTGADSLVLAKVVKGNSSYTKPANGYQADADYDKMKLEWNKAFSSYTARKDIQPVMSFRHLLTRLKFYVKGNGTGPGADEVYVTSVKVKSKATGKLVFVYKAQKNSGIKWTSGVNAVNLSIKEQSATIGDNLLIPLNNGINIKNPQISAYADKAALVAALALSGKTLEEVLGKYHSTLSAGVYSPKQVGESLMVEPNMDTYVAEIEVMQYFDGKGNKIEIPAAADYYTPADKRYYKYSVNVEAKDVTKKNADGTVVNAGLTSFLAGNSYDITILVNGYKDLQVTANLGAWLDGGSIELNPDDDNFVE